MNVHVKEFARDPLSLLIVAQFAFLATGITFLDFSLQWSDAFLAVIAAVVSELTLAHLFGKTMFFPKSAIAAGLGVTLFLRASNPLYFVLAAFAAIASKYFIRIQSGKHIFNPSNFGILSTVLLFPGAATIEFTQWGSDALVYSI